MILDSLENSSSYLPIHPGFEAAFKFLKQNNLTQLKDGRNDIVGDCLYAMVVRDKGKGKKDAIFETHRKYIDIQITLAGCDHIGWENRSACKPDKKGYDAELDCELYSNPPEMWLTVPEGRFAIFFPEDAHAPMGTDEHVHKVVVKVVVDW